MDKVVFLRLAPWMGVWYPHPQDIPYAYDVAQAAAFLDSNQYEVIFIDGMAEKLGINDIVKRIISVNPGVLALTSTSSAAESASEIFSRIKAYLPGLYILGFGQHAHYSPQSFLNQFLHIDACIYAEPEVTLAELIKETPRTPNEKEKVKGIYYWDTELRKTPERPLTVELDQWPMPRYEIFKNRDYRIVSMNFPTLRNIKTGWILASRGCPYDCTICSPAIRRTFGAQLRKHSPEKIADTFRFLTDELAVNTICFGDDVFTLDMDWAENLCDELIKRNNRIQWGMSTRVDRLSAKLIKKMKAAGLRSVAVGVESASERILRDINKKISLAQIEWALSEFEKNKISVNVTAIAGHVDETEDELKQTFSFLKKSKAFFVQFHYLCPYPGTKVTQVFKERLGTVENISHYNTVPLNVSMMPDKVLIGSIQKFYLNYYTSCSFLRKYFRQRLPYLLTNPFKEFTLIKDSCAYFLLSNRYKKFSRVRHPNTNNAREEDK